LRSVRVAGAVAGRTVSAEATRRVVPGGEMLAPTPKQEPRDWACGLSEFLETGE